MHTIQGMRKPFNFLSLILVCSFGTGDVLADETTHQLGNSGYAIRWAMQEGGAKKNPDHYARALKLQREAKAKLAHENEEEAIRLSREAEKEARLSF